MSPRAWVLFAITSLVWGVPYLFIKVAVDADVPPAFVAWSRIALAAALLLPLAAWRGVLRGTARRWRPIVAYAACEIAFPFTLIAIGETRISSSLTAILIASMPLQTTLLVLRFAPHHRPTGLRLAGLALGLAGVVALLGLDVAGEPGELVGALLVLLATLCYSCSALIVGEKLGDLDPLAPVGLGLGLATVALLPAVGGGGAPPVSPPPPRA
jgi:drug/metabolite transporter (DMT)-like permease